MCPATLSNKAGKRLHAAPHALPSSERFHQPRRTTTVRNGQPARCIQGQVAMATESTCYAECLLPSCHRAHRQKNNQPAREPARLSTDVSPLPLILRHIKGGGVRNQTTPPHTHTRSLPNPCMMFFSMVTPPMALFFLPLPPSAEGKKKKVKTTTNKPRGCVVFWCCCHLREVAGGLSRHGSRSSAQSSTPLESPSLFSVFRDVKLNRSSLHFESTNGLPDKPT